MPPSFVMSQLRNEFDKKHSMAVKYIEENVDLIDTDLQKFMNDCPSSCQLEVYDMLQKADIDMTGYVDNTLKQWDIYIHDANPQFHQYYKIDYKQQMDKYITDIIEWKIDYLSEYIVDEA